MDAQEKWIFRNLSRWNCKHLQENKHYDYYVKFYKNKLIEKKITKIFTVYPLDAGSFNFILRNNCFETTKINQILQEHKLSNRFAKEK